MGDELSDEAVLAILVDASRREREHEPNGGWVQPPPKFEGSCHRLLEDGLVETRTIYDRGMFYRPTQAGISKAMPVPVMQ